MRTYLQLWAVICLTLTSAHVTSVQIKAVAYDPHQPTQNALTLLSQITLEGTGENEDVVVVGQHMFVLNYVGAGASQIVAYDISNPAQPALGQAATLQGYPDEMVIVGDYAYIAGGSSDGGNDLQIVNIANPAQMSVVGRLRASGSATDVAVADNKAYLSSVFPGGLRVADVANSASPVTIGNYEASRSFALSLAISGTTAYLSNNSNNVAAILVIDIGNPVIPKFVRAINLTSQIDNVRVVGDKLLVAQYDFGLRIFSLVAAQNPVEVGVVSSRTPSDAVAGIRDVAFLGSANTLEAFDIAQPSSPALIASHTLSTTKVEAIEPVSDLVFVVTKPRGISIFRFRPTRVAQVPVAGTSVTLQPNLLSNAIVTFNFGADTFSDPAIVTYTAKHLQEIPPMGNRLGSSFYYEVSAAKPTGQSLPPQKPYTVTVQYTDADIAAILEDTLKLYSWNGSTWEVEPTSTVNTATNTLIATPNHFSVWAMLGDTKRVYLPNVRR